MKDAQTGAGLADWCVTLVTDAGTAVAQTDAMGNYMFANLGDATYLVCEDLKDGWQQTFPTAAFGGVPCTVGLGWSFPMFGGNVSMVDFRNLKL